LNLITPLNRVLGLGSAKGGTEHWWAQRLTAVALVLLGLWLALSLAALDLSSFASVVSWIQQPMTTVLLVLAVLTMLYHSYLGVQVVVEDYVHGKTKVVVLVVSAFAHAFFAVAGLFSILKIAFGAL
jgi:succinate dehydrogenase / fumarate reductase membrane anchor subunit